MNILQRRLKVIRNSDIHIVVLAVREMANQVGMSAGKNATLATAVSELVTNIIKYAGTGRVTIRNHPRREEPGLEVIVEDHGPGIKDLKQAMTENISSSGSLGLGLPGTKRLVDEFEIHSEVGKGTRIRVVKWG